MKVRPIARTAGMLLILASALIISCSSALEGPSDAPPPEATATRPTAESSNVPPPEATAVQPTAVQPTAVQPTAVQPTAEPIPIFDTTGLTVDSVISRIVDPSSIGIEFASYDAPPETIQGPSHRRWAPLRGDDSIDGIKAKSVGGYHQTGLFKYVVGEFESNGHLYASLLRYKRDYRTTYLKSETQAEFFERGIVVLGAMGFPLENARSTLDQLKSELDPKQLKTNVWVCEGGLIVNLSAYLDEGLLVGYYLQVFPQPCASATKATRTNTIATWTGKSIKDTETFHISTNQWRISWDTWPGEFGAMNFQIYVYGADGTPHAPFVAANVIGEDTDSSIVRGIGDYYLSLVTAQPYKVVVEEIP